MSMFCYQCEQTAGCSGCTVKGVCGKTDRVAALQDLLVHLTKGVSWFANRGNVRNTAIDRGVMDAFFTTVTNVNFDEFALEQVIKATAKLRGEAQELAGLSAPEDVMHPAAFNVPDQVEGMISLAGKFSVVASREKSGDTVAGLRELIVYGLKGAAAYANHAYVLGNEDADVYGKFQEILAFLADTPEDVNALLGNALATGELNFKVMQLLDDANTRTYGHPEPTVVKVSPVKGKCILVSGHDLKDLKMLLEQTEGKGINIYTHGEMLPCLAYPELKKYKHLVGNYGGAWQDQKKEFDAFPGSILMTTNCIQQPADTYIKRIFTTGLVAFPGTDHISENTDGSKDFSTVINAALAAPGFTEDAPEKTITIGFGRNAVLSVADKVIDAVKAGAIKHFFLVGGCDGAKSGRNYYTDLAKAIPQDCVIMTLACGKYRFNKLDFGDIGGIPRLLDIGQCNDAYSAIIIAVKLAEAFGCEVNELPLSLILSWYEQKAVAILLTLLHLGIKNIRLGPSLPAFVTPDALNVLIEKFNIAPVTTPEEDLKAILG